MGVTVSVARMEDTPSLNVGNIADFGSHLQDRAFDIDAWTLIDEGGILMEISRETIDREVENFRRQGRGRRRPRRGSQAMGPASLRRQSRHVPAARELAGARYQSSPERPGAHASGLFFTPGEKHAKEQNRNISDGDRRGQRP